MFAHHFPLQGAEVADMRDLSLGKVFNGLIAWDSFFHLAPDDQRKMFPIFRRHASAGAALMFTSGPSEGEAMGELESELYLCPDIRSHLRRFTRVADAA